MEQILHIDSLAYGSAAVAHDENGKTVFVAGAAPGDTVRTEIDTEKKSFSCGHVLEVIEAGPARVAPVCPVAGTCGGCPWQHIAYEAQLAAKRANAVSALVRIGRFDAAAAEELIAECVPSKKQMGYRNKLEMGTAIGDDGTLQVGLFREGSHELESPATCPLCAKPIQKAPKALRGALRYMQGSTGNLGIYRIGVRASVRANSTEVALWTRPGSFPRSAVAKTLGSALHTTSIVRVMADPGKIRKIKGVEVLCGKGFWEEELGGFEYKVSAPSFFQVNTAQAEQLVHLALAGLEITETDSVADLYCGVGTFTIPLAQLAGQVLGVESAGSSVRDLRRNAEENDVWVEVIGGDSARELPEMGHLDALLVDPPRAGLAPGVIDSIAAAAPTRMAYISCDASTWARDAALLDDAGYRLKQATPVDLFPQTYHCEIVSIFVRE